MMSNADYIISLQKEVQRLSKLVTEEFASKHVNKPLSETAKFLIL